MKNVTLFLFLSCILFLSLSLWLILFLPLSISLFVFPVSFYPSLLCFCLSHMYNCWSSNLPLCPPCRLLLHKKLSNHRAGDTKTEREREGGRGRRCAWREVEWETRWRNENRRNAHGRRGERVLRWCNVASSCRSAQFGFISVCRFLNWSFHHRSIWLIVFIRL